MFEFFFLGFSYIMIYRFLIIFIFFFGNLFINHIIPPIPTHIAGHAARDKSAGTVAATAGLLVVVNVKYDTAAMPEPNDESKIIFSFLRVLLYYMTCTYRCF